MTAHIRKPLLENSSETITFAADATITTDPLMIHQHAEEFIVVSRVLTRTSGTFTTTVQHSPDGIVWFDLQATAAQSAVGNVVATIAKTVSVFPYVRASIVGASTAVGTMSVQLFHGIQRK